MKIITLGLMILSSILFTACSLSPSANVPPTTTSNTFNTVSSTPKTTTLVTPTLKQNSDTVVALNTKYGQIVIKLYSKETPNTVANFLKKANSGFYNNLTFHRVDPGFVVQGGDPVGTGNGGGQIKSELNSIPFKRGSIGLARTPVDKNISNDSQFFICLTTENCSRLTGDYVNFGEVISGMDLIDQIKIGDKIINLTTKTK